MTWTYTETLRRLRAAAKEGRRVARAPRNCPTEVGNRVIPGFLTEPPTTAAEAREAAYPEGDDLFDFDRMDFAARAFAEGSVYVPFSDPKESVSPEGLVVHLYFSERDTEWQGGYLIDIVAVWLGTDEHEPRVIDPRFVSY